MTTTNRWSLVLAFAAGSAAGAGDDEPKGKQKPGGKEQRDPAVIFQRLDKNGDGKITKDELEAVPERLRALVARADANGDGIITKEEFLAAGPGKGLKGKKGEPGKGKGETPKGEPAKDAPKPDGEGKRKQGKGDGGEVFKRLDVNGDGKISRDEAKGPLAEYFDRLDTDKDGFLSESEIRAAREKIGKKGLGKEGLKPGKGGDRKKSVNEPTAEKMEPKKDGGPDFAVMFQRLDSNGDGKISKEEARGPFAENFDRFDLNKDGFISKSEIEEAGKRMKAAGPMKGLLQPEASLVNLFNQQDVDADGRVTRAEAKGKLLEHFDELDADKDGKLTRQEVEAGMKKLGEKSPPKK